MSEKSKTPHTELSNAYIEFASSMFKISTEVYAKTWEDSVKFHTALTKSAGEFYKDLPFLKSINDLYSASLWKK